MTCPFCEAEAEVILERHAAILILRDKYPVSPGHSLILPTRHFASYFEATEKEREALFEGLLRAKRIVERNHKPDGWNIGWNDGTAAGQTIGHLHLHLIPRYDGDRPDPRGGIRWIFPDKAAYWR